MAKCEGIKSKETQAKAIRVYRAFISGMNHANLGKEFKISQSTVQRYIEWAKDAGFNALPEDDELLESTLNDINIRRAELTKKLKNKNVDDYCKLNKAIHDLDNQRLTLKGLIEHRSNVKVEGLSKISDEDLLKFIDEDKEAKKDNEAEE